MTHMHKYDQKNCRMKKILLRYEETEELLCGMKVSDVKEDNLFQATDQLRKSCLHLRCAVPEIIYTPPTEGIAIGLDWIGLEFH